MHCDKNKLAKEFAAMYSDNEEQAAAVKEVDRAFARMETVTPKAVNPDEQSIIVVCKGFGDEGDDTVCIEVGDLRNWKEKHTKKSEPISDEMLTFMSTDEIENAVMNQDLPTKYAFELSAWDEILSWKLAPSSIYIHNKAVKKTLSIPSCPNDMAERADINFSGVLQEALKANLNIG